MNRKDKRGLSQIISIILFILIILSMTVIIFNVVNSIVKRNNDVINTKTRLLVERGKILRVNGDPVSPGIFDVSFRRDTVTKNIDETIVTVNDVELDIVLVTDKSGSMEQSGWTADLAPSLVPVVDQTLNVPFDDYSSFEQFNVPVGTERIAVTLEWDRRVGYEGSEGSEFALNLRDPGGTWFYGDGITKPNVLGGEVDPDGSGTNTLLTNQESFSGICTKPQVVIVENPMPGNWQVKVYAWNLRPKEDLTAVPQIFPPSDQDVDLKVYLGNAADVTQNPTVISFDASKQSLKNFVTNTFAGPGGADDRIGVVSFSTNANNDRSLIDDEVLLHNSIDSISNGGGTRIERGISEAIIEFNNNARADAKKVMVILTDGQNDVDPQNVMDEANIAKAQGITIFTVGLTGFVNQDMLSLVASQPSYYYYAPSASDLDFILTSLQSEIVNTFHKSSYVNYRVEFFSNTGEQYFEDITVDLPGSGEVGTFSIDLTGKLVNVKSVEIYAFLYTDTGEFIMSHMIDSFTF